MSGFVSRAGDPAQLAEECDRPILGDGWYPDIDLEQLRAAQRIFQNVTPARLREAVMAGIESVGSDLTDWRDDRLEDGAASLAAVSAAQIDGEPRLVVLYRRAVGCYARAELLERYRDFDLTSTGQRDGEIMVSSAAEQRRDALHAVRDIMGKRRTTVDLL